MTHFLLFSHDASRVIGYPLTPKNSNFRQEFRMLNGSIVPPFLCYYGTIIHIAHPKAILVIQSNCDDGNLLSNLG
jgi:hypothetical protein